ncbi:Site-specific recombinase, phage integrase family protein [Oleispira antarctica RB-8]|uniref:Site-specific recombinase, phage integrase family protein n=1 Tax=Oleispira antarctica RB-8 TaxID=698738 RepID=R4YKV2_OLEAN|nr:Site-specific recombinase, phage integrase family protein [Oleispira antarctica RB-8]
MAKIPTPLNSSQIKNAKPKDKEYNLADGQKLSLRIKPSGSKAWIFTYQRPYTKKRTNLGFGSYPEVSLASARKLRTEALILLADNIDPQEHKAEQRQKNELAHLNTLEHVAKQWHEVKKTSVSASYSQKIFRALELHILPKLGKFPIHKIKASQTIEVLKPLAEAGKLDMIKRVTQAINQIMTFAVNTGIIHHNPLANITKAFESPKKRHQLTLEPKELPALMKALSYANIQLLTRVMIEWQLHTMSRPSETAGARWEEIDLEAKLWNIPAERMKMKRPHTIPLSPQTLELLEIIRPHSIDSEYLFPSDMKKGQHRNTQTANMALKRMGYGGRLVAHGLRALASTTLNEHEFNPDVIEAALAHTDKNEIRAAYNRAQYLEKRRVMMCWWSDEIEGKNKNDDNVVKLMRDQA